MTITTCSAPLMQSLEKIALFRCLSPELIERIQTLCTWKRYEPGEQIIDYLDQSDEVFFIADGNARVSITSMQGRPVAFTDLDAGDIFGEISAIDGGPRSVSVGARTRCCVVSLPAAAFEEIVKSEPAFALELLQHLTQKIRVLITRVYYLCSLDVANRTRAELLRLAKLAPQEGNSALLDPMPTHAEIASRIGAHRETVTREFNRLSKFGLLVRRDHALLVTNVRVARDYGSRGDRRLGVHATYPRRAADPVSFGSWLHENATDGDRRLLDMRHVPRCGRFSDFAVSLCGRT